MSNISIVTNSERVNFDMIMFYLGRWSNAELHEKHGLADIIEIPAMITDIGMNAAGRAFTYCRNLSIYNCPHLHGPTSWFSTGEAFMRVW